MKLIKITEGKVNLSVPDPQKYKLDSHMPVFFNPVMKLNRDISIILMRALNRKLNCLDLLSASGARGIRIAKEIPKSEVTVNDANPSAAELIEKNAKTNGVNVEVTNCSANRFLRESRRKWDYIDIDPFGTPMPFLENSIKRLAKNGILAITATDTSALCGTYPSACKRKYNSKSLRCPPMHELGLRLLITATQNTSEKQGVSLVPIFSHSSNHYMRVYFKQTTKKIAPQKGYFIYDFSSGKMKITKTQPKLKVKEDYAGPLWVGKLWDKSLVKKMILLIDKKTDTFNGLVVDKQSDNLIRKIYEESSVDSVGFYDLHVLAKIHKLLSLPKITNVIIELQKKGFKAERTHITPTGIKTNAKLKYVLAAVSIVK